MPNHGMTYRIATTAFLLSGALGFLSAPIHAEPATTLPDPAFQQAVEQVVERYLRSHPEVIEQSLRLLHAKRQAEEREQTRQIILTKQTELLHDPTSPVSGNLEGDVTVVEFFDYRCGYCKRVAGTVTQLQQDDPNVKIVYKDYPILGEASEVASRAALASKIQGKHLAFHEALLASEQELTQDSILNIAAEVGLDNEQLIKDMQAPSIQAIINRNRELARKLGINGTPGFIIGTELAPGALNLDELKNLVSQTRREKH